MLELHRTPTNRLMTLTNYNWLTPHDSLQLTHDSLQLTHDSQELTDDSPITNVSHEPLHDSHELHVTPSRTTIWISQTTPWLSRATTTRTTRLSLNHVHSFTFSRFVLHMILELHITITNRLTTLTNHYWLNSHQSMCIHLMSVSVHVQSPAGDIERVTDVENRKCWCCFVSFQ